MIVPFALVLALAAQGASQVVSAPLQNPCADDTGTVAVSAGQVARVVQQLPSDATIAVALQSIRAGMDSELNPARSQRTRDEAAAAEQVLADLGFSTVLDLQLLAGGPEAAELMSKLRTSSKLSIAVRAKMRLLVGDAEHLARVSKISPSPASRSAKDVDHGSSQGVPGVPATPRQHRQHRQLQDGATGTDKLSFDAIAIVFSVCVGVCGYLLQAWTSVKASRHTSELQREAEKEARELQAEHVRAQAQIRRTERWVDDCCTPMGRTLSQYSNARLRFGECHSVGAVLVPLLWFLFGFQWFDLCGALPCSPRIRGEAGGDPIGGIRRAVYGLLDEAPGCEGGWHNPRLEQARLRSECRRDDDLGSGYLGSVVVRR